MKQFKQLSLIAAALFFAAFTTTSLVAQTDVKDAMIKKEMEDLAKQWEDAYNRSDVDALAQMYTRNVVVVKEDDSNMAITRDDVKADFEKNFENADLHSYVQVDDAQVQPDGRILITGKFSTIGKNRTTGELVSQSGTYSHLVKKEDKSWKLNQTKVVLER